MCTMSTLLIREIWLFLVSYTKGIFDKGLTAETGVKIVSEPRKNATQLNMGKKMKWIVHLAILSELGQ